MKNARTRRFVPCALRLESRRLLTHDFHPPTWLGQGSNLDLAGPTAAVGPDGIIDDEIQLVTTDSSVTLTQVQLNLQVNNTNSGEYWETSPDLDGYTNAEVIKVASETYDVYLNPTGNKGIALTGASNQELLVYVSYTNSSGSHVDDLSLAPSSSNPNLADSLSAPTSANWNGLAASWYGQVSGGLVQINVSGLPYQIQGAMLSDQSYHSWSYGSLYSPPQQQLSSISQNLGNDTGDLLGPT